MCLYVCRKEEEREWGEGRIYPPNTLSYIKERRKRTPRREEEEEEDEEGKGKRRRRRRRVKTLSSTSLAKEKGEREGKKEL